MILKQSVFLAFLIGAMFFGSCKKDKKSKLTEETQTPELLPGKYVEGYISIGRYIEVYGKQANGSSSNSSVQYFDRPIHIDSIDYSNSLYVGRIQLNNVFLSSARPGSYYDSTYTNFNPPFRINNSASSGNVPLINFSFDQEFPAYSGFSNLPDTIFASEDITFKLRKYTSTNKIQITLGCGSMPRITRNLQNGDSLVTFPLQKPEYPFEEGRSKITLLFSNAKILRLNDKWIYVQTSLFVDLVDLPTVYEN